MTYEEAIEEMENIYQNGFDNDFDNDEIEKPLDAIRIAIKAIEKQIPRRIVDGNFCPRCNVGFGIHYPEWCGSCGQRIDYNLEKQNDI